MLTNFIRMVAYYCILCRLASAKSILMSHAKINLLDLINHQQNSNGIDGFNGDRWRQTPIQW